MQIVIELDDEMYKLISTNIDVYVLDEVDFILIENAIANGTPLPKGHGDLKDMNDLCYKSRYGCKSNCDYLHTCNLYDAPTIIEADKTESENKK